MCCRSSFAFRYGSATFLSVDDGDGDLYNASLVLEGRQLLEMDGTDGILVGGSPEYDGVTMFKVHNDFHDGRKSTGCSVGLNFGMVKNVHL